jgi:hypothetical protein
MMDCQKTRRSQRGPAKHVLSDEPINIERLERALAFAAYLVERDGSKAVPIFECIERELMAKKAEQGTVERAKRLLESCGYQPATLLAADCQAA